MSLAELEIRPTAGPFVTVDQLRTRHPGISTQTLRWWLFHRRANGLAASGAVLKIGARKLLIDEGRFLTWLASHAEQLGEGGQDREGMA